jgi:myo-inositol-1(or 4)-monophosphatase
VATDPKLLSEIIRIAEEAGAIAQESRKDLRRELKADVSIVTAGDRAVETFLREKLTNLLPGTGVYGEEFGCEDEGPNGLWVVDPIDGTSNYAFGSPLWGVSIGLLQGDAITLGVVYLPDLGEMYSAALGGGSRCNGEALPDIPPGEIRREELLSYNENLLKAFPGQPWPGKMRCSGAFVIDAMWVARQRYRGLIGIRGKLYDIAASRLIVSELGGEVLYIDGASIRLSELKTGATIPKPYGFLPQGAGPLI